MTAWKSRTLWTTVVLFVLLFVTPGMCGTSVPAGFAYTEGTENERIKHYFRVHHNVKKKNGLVSIRSFVFSLAILLGYIYYA